MTGFLSKAIEIAVVAHAGQQDKAKKPYILHPIAVMLDPDLTNSVEKAVAILHDVVEDTDFDLNKISTELLSVAPAPVVLLIADAIGQLTRRRDMSYETYLEGIKVNPIALKVKKADIRHNSSRERLDAIPNNEERERMIQKYTKARIFFGMEPIQSQKAV